MNVCIRLCLRSNGSSNPSMTPFNDSFIQNAEPYNHVLPTALTMASTFANARLNLRTDSQDQVGGAQTGSVRILPVTVDTDKSGSPLGLHLGRHLREFVILISTQCIRKLTMAAKQLNGAAFTSHTH